jgi:hypothetical protein
MHIRVLRRASQKRMLGLGLKSKKLPYDRSVGIVDRGPWGTNQIIKSCRILRGGMAVQGQDFPIRKKWTLRRQVRTQAEREKDEQSR